MGEMDKEEEEEEEEEGRRERGWGWGWGLGGWIWWFREREREREREEEEGGREVCVRVARELRKGEGGERIFHDLALFASSLSFPLNILKYSCTKLTTIIECSRASP